MKAGATPDNLPGVQAALYKLEALQDAILVDAPKGEKVHIWLSQAQVKAIMAECGDDCQGKRDWIVLGLLLGAGVRCDELVRSTFDDLVDLPMQKNGKRTCLQIRGKGDKVRTIPLKPVLAARLEEMESGCGSLR